MSRNGKIILGVLAGVLVLCVCVAVAGSVLFRAVTKSVVSNMATQPEEAAQVGQKIADYTLPKGWQEQFGMNLLGVSIVAFSAGSPDQVVMLMQMPANSEMNQAAMEAQLRQALERQSPGSTANMTATGSRKVTVRGQPVTLTVSEGTNAQGQHNRSLMGVFEGHNGPVMLMAVGPIDSWNDQGIDAFLTSIR